MKQAVSASPFEDFGALQAFLAYLGLGAVLSLLILALCFWSFETEEIGNDPEGDTKESYYVLQIHTWYHLIKFKGDTKESYYVLQIHTWYYLIKFK